MISATKDRSFGLDIVRAAAILFVVYTHGAYHLATVLPASIVRIPLMDGVSIFFVLSGYLIGGILIRQIERRETSAHALTGFWYRRWLRTIPNYLLILSILSVHAWIFSPEKLPGELWRYILFIQNINGGHPSFFPEAWSLSVEEWFYLLFPALWFVTIATKISPQKAILFWIVVMALSAIVYRHYIFTELYDSKIGLGEWDKNIRRAVLTRLDSIVYGVLGAYIAHYHAAIWSDYRKQALVVGLLLMLLFKLAALFWTPTFQNHAYYFSVVSFPTIALGTLLLFPYLTTIERRDTWVVRSITTISLLSYSMYLVHLSLVQRILVPIVMDMTRSWSGPLQAIVFQSSYWILTLLVSLLIYRYFESPILRYRDRNSKASS